MKDKNPEHDFHCLLKLYLNFIVHLETFHVSLRHSTNNINFSKCRNSKYQAHNCLNNRRFQFKKDIVIEDERYTTHCNKKCSIENDKFIEPFFFDVGINQFANTNDKGNNQTNFGSPNFIGCNKNKQRDKTRKYFFYKVGTVHRQQV